MKFIYLFSILVIFLGFVTFTCQDVADKKGCDCSICQGVNNKIQPIVGKKHDDRGKPGCNICERKKEILRMERERQQKLQKCPFEILGSPAVKGKTSEEIFDEFRELIVPSQNGFFDMMRGIVKTMHVTSEAELIEAKEKEAKELAKKKAEEAAALKANRGKSKKPEMVESPKVTVVLKQTPCGQFVAPEEKIEAPVVPFIKRLPKQTHNEKPLPEDFSPDVQMIEDFYKEHRPSMYKEFETEKELHPDLQLMGDMYRGDRLHMYEERPQLEEEYTPNLQMIEDIPYEKLMQLYEESLPFYKRMETEFTPNQHIESNSNKEGLSTQDLKEPRLEEENIPELQLMKDPEELLRSTYAEPRLEEENIAEFQLMKDKEELLKSTYAEDPQTVAEHIPDLNLMNNFPDKDVFKQTYEGEPKLEEESIPSPKTIKNAPIEANKDNTMVKAKQIPGSQVFDDITKGLLKQSSKIEPRLEEELMSYLQLIKGNLDDNILNVLEEVHQRAEKLTPDKQLVEDTVVKENLSKEIQTEEELTSELHITTENILNGDTFSTEIYEESSLKEEISNQENTNEYLEEENQFETTFLPQQDFTTTHEDISNDIDSVTESPYVKFMSNEEFKALSGKEHAPVDDLDMRLNELASQTEWGLLEGDGEYLNDDENMLAPTQ